MLLSSSIGKGVEPESSLAIDCRMLFMSGIGRYLREILSRIPHPKASFAALYNQPEQKEWLMARCSNARCIFEAGDIYGVGEQWRRPWLLRKAKVVWTPHYNFPVFSLSKQVVTVHDVAHLALPEVFGRGVRRFYARMMFQALARKADRTIFVSEFTRREFTRLLRREPRRSTVINQGISGEWFKATRKPVGNYLLYVGNVKPHKNLGRLILALKGISHEIPCNLRIVGKRHGFIVGDKLQGLDDPIVAQRIEFTGEIDDEALKAQYAGATALVFPSLYEGFGFPPLEAMAAGCPVLISRSGSLREVCGDEYDVRKGTGNAMYFDALNPDSIAQAIKAFLKLNEGERCIMTENARNHVKKYNWEETAAATWSVIGDALSQC